MEFLLGQIIALLLAITPTATLTKQPNTNWNMATNIKEYKGRAHNSKTIKHGEKFGKLSVIGEAEKRGSGNRRMICQCECGKTTVVDLGHLLNLHSKSCGCFVFEVMAELHKTHGLSNTAEYAHWKTMKRRCYDNGFINFPSYGGASPPITVCTRWRESFPNFLEDMGPMPTQKHTVDRIASGGNYEPSNCRWATRLEQNRNRRSNLLTMKDAEAIREMRAENISVKSIAERFDVKIWVIYDVLSCRSWNPNTT